MERLLVFVTALSALAAGDATTAGAPEAYRHMRANGLQSYLDFDDAADPDRSTSRYGLFILDSPSTAQRFQKSLPGR